MESILNHSRLFLGYIYLEKYFLENYIFKKLSFWVPSGSQTNNIFLSEGDQKEQCLLRRKRELLFFSDTGRASGIRTTGYLYWYKERSRNSSREVNSLQNSPRFFSRIFTLYCKIVKILWLGGCWTLVTWGKWSREIRRGHQKLRTEYFQDLHLPLDQSLADGPSHCKGKTWSVVKLLY